MAESASSLRSAQSLCPRRRGCWRTQLLGALRSRSACSAQEKKVTLAGSADLEHSFCSSDGSNTVSMFFDVFRVLVFNMVNYVDRNVQS